MRVGAAPETKPSPLMAWALRYATRGWHVFPCHTMRNGSCTCSRAVACDRPAKHFRTRSGLKDATTDREQIRRWWTQWQDANIAIRTGAVSGVVVLDVDHGRGGDAALLELVDREGPIDWIAHVVTGSGGEHFFLRYPGRRTPNAIDRPATGIDIRGDGGYVVCPPSLHASGCRYVWCHDHPAPVGCWCEKPRRRAAA